MFRHSFSSFLKRFGLVPLLLSALLCLTARAQNFADSGFVAETVATLPPYKPVGLAFAPDGRIFVWQKDGIVRIIKNGALLPTPFIDLSDRVNTYNDRGMLGLALDPNFAASGFVWLLYAYEPGPLSNDSAPRTGRLTRVRANPADPDVALPGSETVILGSLSAAPCTDYPDGADCIGSEGNTHSVGTVRFAPDGKLFVSIGDGASPVSGSFNPQAMRAQNLNSYNGKILRLNPDGTAPPDNPFYDGNPNSIRSKVYAYGLRNPYRFALHPVTGEPYIGDVGWSGWEEQNRGRGANFGWPCYEGNEPQPEHQAWVPQCQALPASAVTKPLYTYDHLDGDAAAVGGAFYFATQFPAQYRGSYFFADYARQWIRRMSFNDDGSVAAVTDFATAAGAVVALEAGPDGALYYVDIVSGEVRRIRYAGAVPTAAAAANVTAGYAPLTVTFSSQGSNSPDGGALTYQWNFGDGATSTAPAPTHTYTVGGVTTFTATLTVTNAQNRSATAQVKITVGSLPPVAAITVPASDARFADGTTVNFAGQATDPDETLTADALNWQVLLHHDSHVHPLLSATGSGGSFVIGVHDGGTYFYEIIFTVTDSSGLKSVRRVNVYAQAALPAPWHEEEIGLIAGSASYANSAFSLKAASGDIWGTYDTFRFVWQPLAGDGQIVARVSGFQNAHPWAKAGVIMREDLTRPSRHALMALTGGNGTAFQFRAVTEGDSEHRAGDGFTTQWVRLLRQGNTITGYQSNDGAVWQMVGSITFTAPLPDTLYVGLALSNNDEPTQCTAVFENVSVTGLSATRTRAPARNSRRPVARRAN